MRDFGRSSHAIPVLVLVRNAASIEAGHQREIIKHSSRILHEARVCGITDTTSRR